MLLPGDPGQTDRPPLQARGRGPGRPLSWVIPPCPFTRGPHTDEKPRPETSTKPGPVGVAPGPGSVAVGRESRAAYWVHEAQDEPAMGAASVHAALSSGAATHLGRARLGAVEGSGGFCPGVVGWGLNGEGCPREQDGRVRASQRNPHAGETSPGATATLAGCPRPPPPPRPDNGMPDSRSAHRSWSAGFPQLPSILGQTLINQLLFPSSITCSSRHAGGLSVTLRGSRIATPAKRSFLSLMPAIHFYKPAAPTKTFKDSSRYRSTPVSSRTHQDSHKSHRPCVCTQNWTRCFQVQPPRPERL